MIDKLSEEIALHYETINELKAIKNEVLRCCDTEVILKISMRQNVGFNDIFTRKEKLTTSVSTIILVLNGLIEKEKQAINKLIDEEVELRMDKI